MKINLDKIIFSKINKRENNNISDKSTLPSKKTDYNSPANSEVYNQAVRATYVQPRYFDISIVTKPHNMAPLRKYIVAPDSKFKMGDYTLDLALPEIQQMINSLNPGQALIFGRNGINPDKKMNRTVSRQHLQLEKNDKGQLIAQDLKSTQGTSLLPNVFRPDYNNAPFTLIPNKKYLFPKNSGFKINDYCFDLNRYKEIIQNMENGSEIKVGRYPNNDITLDNPFVSGYHMLIQRCDDNIIVTDLNSTNGTKFTGFKKQDYLLNYENITDITTLQKNVPTLIPSDSQLYLGNSFTIDMRNPNIKNLLDKKGIIYVGRCEPNDIQVSKAHSTVSRTHLKLEKSGESIIATDISKTNKTHVVPKNKIQPFYNGVKDIFLAQSNIGDCFLLSTLYAMSHTPSGQNMLLNMVSIDNNGNYWVKFYNNSPIKVKLEELDGQKSNKSEKISVSGDLGIKAIERAYAKMIKNIFNSFNADNNTMFMAIDHGGWMDTALKKMTGLKSYSFNPMKSDMRPIFNKILKNGIDNYILTCSTFHKGNYDKYMDPKRQFRAKHAYAVFDINPKKRTITIVNPHNTQKHYELSWEEFSKYFDMFFAAPTEKGLSL